MIVSFFSFKGGAGRTTSAINTAYYLITKLAEPTEQKPFIIIDADTESAGISYLLLGRNKKGDTYEPKQSIQGLFVEKNNNIFSSNQEDGCSGDINDYTELRKFFVEVGDKFSTPEKPVKKAAVLLLRANVISDELKRGFDNSQSQASQLTSLLDVLANNCQCNVLFDTPSGTQALSTFALRNSDTIVCHMRPTKQFQDGTYECLRHAIKSLRNKRIIVCPSVVPMDAVTINDREYPTHYKSGILRQFVGNLKAMADDFGNRIVVNGDMANATPDDCQIFGDKISEENRQKLVIGLPELVRFKWEEGILPIIEDLKQEELIACERYYYLASIITGKVKKA